MINFLIVATYFSGLTLSGLQSQDPVKPSTGDNSTPVNGGNIPLQGAKKIQVIDQEDEPPMGGPWWEVLIQFIDGSDEMFYLPEDEHIEGDPMPPPGWTELVDEDGHKIWVEEDAVSSATANGPYWRGS